MAGRFWERQVPNYGASFGGYAHSNSGGAYRSFGRPNQSNPYSNTAIKRSRSPPRYNQHYNSRGQNQPGGSYPRTSGFGPQTQGGSSPFIASRYEIYSPGRDLTLHELNVCDIRMFHSKVSVPPDFFHCDLSWQIGRPIGETTSSFQMFNKHADFHILNHEVERPVTDNCSTDNEELLNPSDADTNFSARVMLLASPDFQELLSRTMRTPSESSNLDKVSWLKQVHFLVGCLGAKKEIVPIGGAWSPSLDGPDPAMDENVLINTAIRTCRAQTGIDLSCCTNWFKFLELHYYRPASQSPADPTTTEADIEDSSGCRSGAEMASRVETVVVFVPDLYSCMPASREDWAAQCQLFRELCEQRLSPQANVNWEVEPAQTEEPIPSQDCEKNKFCEDEDIGVECQQEFREEENRQEVAGGEPANPIDVNASASTQEAQRATHYSQLDVSSLRVAELKAELAARSIDFTNCLRTQLVIRLEAALKDEERREKASTAAAAAANLASSTTASQSERAELSERDRRRLERHYRLDEEKPAVLVFPCSQLAGGLQFDCEKMSLHSLLENSLIGGVGTRLEARFEVALFAEQFRDYVMRDAVFSIYKALNVYDLQNSEDSTTLSPLGPSVAAGSTNGGKEDDALSSSGSKRRREGNSESRSSAHSSSKVIADPTLLFAFSVFDTGKCEYIKEGDLEAILTCIGSQLSRSQLRKLIFKASGRKEILQYRRLTDAVEGCGEEPLTKHSCLDDPDYIKELTDGNAIFLVQNEGVKQKVYVTNNEENIAAVLKNCEKTRRNSIIHLGQVINDLVDVRGSFLEAKREMLISRAEIEELHHKLQQFRERLREARSNQRSCSRLLKISADHFGRISKEITSQFEREKHQSGQKFFSAMDLESNQIDLTVDFESSNSRI